MFVLYRYIVLLHIYFFFFNDTATTEIYTTEDTLSLHDALPTSPSSLPRRRMLPCGSCSAVWRSARPCCFRRSITCFGFSKDAISLQPSAISDVGSRRPTAPFRRRTPVAPPTTPPTRRR